MNIFVLKSHLNSHTQEFHSSFPDLYPYPFLTTANMDSWPVSSPQDVHTLYADLITSKSISVTGSILAFNFSCLTEK